MGFRKPALAFGWLLVLMSGYYLVKPVRNALVSELPPAELPYLFLAVLVVVALLNACYDWLARHLRPVLLISVVTVFFAGLLAVFAVGLGSTQAAAGTSDAGPIRRAWILGFYLFVAAYNVLTVTMFWSFANGIFSGTGAGKIYGRVAAGGTIGAAMGSALVAAYFPGSSVLLGSGAVLLVLTLAFLYYLSRESAGESRSFAAEDRPAGDSSVSGMDLVRTSGYLQLILLAVLLMTISATFLGYKMNLLVKFGVVGEGSRTTFWAQINLAVSLAGLVLQTLVIGPVLRVGGIRAALVWAPLVDMLGGSLFLMGPGLTAGGAVYTASSASRYSFARVSKELLYSPLGPAERYQAKALIDTFVYRLGDASASIVLLFYPTLSVRVAAGLWLAAACLRLWPALSLSRHYDRLALRAPDPSSEDSPD